MDILKEEIKLYPNVPILTLGEPILSAIVNDNVFSKVNYYWGYNKLWKYRRFEAFKYIDCYENKLGRIIIPFPHQPSMSRKEFYKFRFDDYCTYINNCIYY